MEGNFGKARVCLLRHCAPLLPHSPHMAFFRPNFQAGKHWLHKHRIEWGSGSGRWVSDNTVRSGAPLVQQLPIAFPSMSTKQWKILGSITNCNNRRDVSFEMHAHYNMHGPSTGKKVCKIYPLLLVYCASSIVWEAKLYYIIRYLLKKKGNYLYIYIYYLFSIIIFYDLFIFLFFI